MLAALGLFLAQGIKKTTMDDVAVHTGITRVTVYRYFGEKKQLVRAAFMRIISVFQEVQNDIYQEQSRDVEKYIDRIAAELATLPKGDLPSRMEELGRLYPDVLVEFHQARLAAAGKIFDRLFGVATEQGLLREGLNQAVVQTFFVETAVKVMESPSLLALGSLPAEIFSTVKAIFLHGILKG